MFRTFGQLFGQDPTDLEQPLVNALRNEPERTAIRHERPWATHTLRLRRISRQCCVANRIWRVSSWRARTEEIHGRGSIA